MDIFNYLAKLELGWLLRGQFVLIGLLITGAITSQWGKPLRLRADNWATISFVLGCLVLLLLTLNSTKLPGHTGYELYGFVTIHINRAIFYTILLLILTRRLIKTCKAERIRKVRFNLIMSKRRRGLSA